MQLYEYLPEEKIAPIEYYHKNNDICFTCMLNLLKNKNTSR